MVYLSGGKGFITSSKLASSVIEQDVSEKDTDEDFSENISEKSSKQ